MNDELLDLELKVHELRMDFRRLIDKQAGEEIDELLTIALGQCAGKLRKIEDILISQQEWEE